MASPDFRQYVDLTINDVQPSTIYDDAVSYAQTVLPDFQPREGTVEDAVLQAMSYVAALMTGAINRLPNGLMEGVLNLLGFARAQSSFATGAVIFTIVDSNGATIPAGTRVAYTDTVDGVTAQYIFETTEQATIDAGGNTSSAVPVRAAATGVQPVIDDGDTMLLLTSSNRIFSVAFSGTLTQGAASESDEEYFARGATYIASLSESLATKQQITNYILSAFTDVRRCVTLDQTDLTEVAGVQIFETGGTLGASTTIDPTGLFPTPSAGEYIRIVGASDSKFNAVFEIDSLDSTTIYVTNTSGASTGETLTDDFTIELLKQLERPDTSGGVSLYGSSPAAGYVTTVVADSNGDPVSSTLKTSISDAIVDRVVAGLDFTIIDALRLDVEVTVDFALSEGFNELTVRDNVELAVADYISPANWNWETRIRVNSIIALVTAVPGVDYVDSVSFTLASPEPLANIDGVSGDVDILFRGTLPNASSVTVGVV